MNRKNILFSIAIFSLLLAACGSPKPESTTPTVLPDMILTAAAQTAGARLTELAQPNATQPPAPSETPALPVATATSQATGVTGTPLSGATPTLGALTPTIPAGTALPSQGDQAEMVSETIPDGTDFDPGEAFVKTWAVKNTGTSTWSTGYSLAFLSGAQLGGPESVALTKSIAPGEVVDVSVNFSAPQESGTHRGYWKMRNASGQFFDYAMWVEIDVVGGTPGVNPTSQPGGGEDISGVSIAVDEASASDCPHVFNFTATFTLNKAATVTYRLEAGSNTPGFTFSLPGDQTVSFEAGTHAVTYNLNIEDAVDGWVQFHILSPEDVTSKQESFTLTCSP